MTCDERIEKTLNKCGQTISDLPKAYSYDQMIKADETVTAYLAKLYPNDPIGNEPENFLWFILHLTDIIDRLEWALENVCGERDYLRSVVCGLCSSFRKDGADDCETCIVGDGIPEYWSADDENR